MAKRREDIIKRKNTIIMVVLGIILAAIFVSTSDIGKAFLENIQSMMDSSNKVTEIAPAQSPDSNDKLLVYYFDVGQGDSELIRIPDGSGNYFNMLIDSGDAEHTDAITAYLDGLEITKLDAVVVTHPHADHMGSMASIIERYAIDRFYMPRFPSELTPTTVSYEKMLDALTAKNLGITVIKTGTVITTTDLASVTVLAPDDGDKSDNLNNYSAVIKVVFGDRTFLFMGDAEEDELSQILQSGYSLDSDVIKIGHHGSSDATNGALLEAVSPEIAVISCGTGNSYGHPHEETLDLLKKYNVTVYRTDLDGTVVIESDGKAVNKLAS